MTEEEQRFGGDNMMDLDEAIKHCEEVAESKKKQVENGDWEKGSPTERNCLECASEHRQLAEWLKVLKAYRENTCGDAISRQAAIDVLTKTSGIRGDALKALYDLPSVSPKQRTGQWITSHIPESVLCECSECGFSCGAYSFNYCPTCGAKMEVEEC